MLDIATQNPSPPSYPLGPTHSVDLLLPIQTGLKQKPLDSTFNFVMDL